MEDSQLQESKFRMQDNSLALINQEKIQKNLDIIEQNFITTVSKIESIN